MTIHLLICGKVQGVYFRASAKEKADALGLSGWVRNTAAGDVEAVASGSQASLDAFTEWCHQGPPSAQVTSVEVQPADDYLQLGFVVKR